MLRLYILPLLLLLAVSCQNSQQVDEQITSPSLTPDEEVANPTENNTTDRTFTPGKRIGQITAQSTPESVRATYGEDALVDSLLWGPEGMRYPGFILFGGTVDELELSFDDEAGVSGEIFHDQSTWISAAEGIRIGTSLETLNQLNGRPFTFSGFGWDYGGNVMDWKDGNLEGHRLKLQYDPKKVDMSVIAGGEIMGDFELSSDLPVLKNIDVTVNGIYFILE